MHRLDFDRRLKALQLYTHTAHMYINFIFKKYVNIRKFSKFSPEVRPSKIGHCAVIPDAIVRYNFPQPRSNSPNGLPFIVLTRPSGMFPTYS